MLKLAYTAIALSIGVGFSVQTTINAALARGIGSPVIAALISFGVGFAALVGLSAVSGQFQTWNGMRGIPIWMWLTGGLIGASIVFCSLFLVPRIGVAALAAFVIAGQLTAAAVLDHYGLFGMPVHEINLWRIVGIVMLFAGAMLVRLN